MNKINHILPFLELQISWNLEKKTDNGHNSKLYTVDHHILRNLKSCSNIVDISKFLMEKTKKKSNHGLKTAWM